MPDMAPATNPIPLRGHQGEQGLHEIVVVGGGAAGLELVTKLGDTLGRAARRASPWSRSRAPISGSRCCTRLPPAACAGPSTS